jgi:hypothetical protein
VKFAIRIAVLLIATALLFPFLSFQTAARTAQSSTADTKKAAPKGTPSEQEIAEAKAKGLVWVNSATRVYHKDGPLYGKTKLGKFMTEEDAKKAGYRIASETGNSKNSGQPK